MGELGDIGAFLKEGGLANLDWLDVNEEDYRALDTLPKQNLDVVPDLQAAWSHEGSETATKFVPNREGQPRTVGDLSEEHGLLRTKPDEIAKVARLALMQSDDFGRFQQALRSRYASATLRQHREILASILAERGVLGRVYIDSADFPGCHTGSKRPSDFVRRYASDARFVVAKPECSGCVHKHNGPKGGDTCSVFHKEIQIEVPYSAALATEVEQMQRARGKDVQLLAAETPKERVRLAMLASDVPIQKPAQMPKPKDEVSRLLRPVTEVPEIPVRVNIAALREAAREVVNIAFRNGNVSVTQAQDLYFNIAHTRDPAQLGEIATTTAKVANIPVPTRFYQGMGEQPAPLEISRADADGQLIAASNLTRKRDEDTRRMLASERAKPIVETLRREMLKGRSVDELTHVLKHAFQSTDLKATHEHWAPMFREAGLYGVLYSTQDSFDDCRQGHDFIAKHNPGIKTIVAGSKCSGCIYNKIGRCLLYGKPLTSSVEEVLTWENVEKALQDHKAAGRLVPWGPPSGAWGSSPREALQKMHREATLKSIPGQAQTRLEVVRAFHGAASSGVKTSAITQREITKTASRYMNEGLYGRDLLAALKARFDSRDLVATKDGLRSVLAEQGLQGVYFVDPSIYDDYGKGCDEASRLHRARLVEYVRAGDRCGSCVLQTRPGFCSKLNKALVDEPPYYDKTAQQREILSSGQATEMSFSNIMNNGMSMMVEYDLQNSPMSLELDATKTATDIDIEFGTGGQGVRL